MADDLELTDEEREHIKARRAEKKQKAWNPKLASDYTPEEKAVAFDKIHKLALEHFEGKKKDGWGLKDVEHWFYEAGMELLGEGVWDVLNSFEG